MNPLAFLLGLSPRAYLGLAIVLAIAAAAVGHVIDVKVHERRADAAGYMRGKGEIQSRWDAERVQQQAAAIRAQLERAAETERRIAAQQEKDRVDEKRASQRRADLAALDARAGQLRERLAAIAAGSTDRGGAAGDAPPAGQCQAAEATARVLAELLGRAERRARAVEPFADAAADVAESCVGRYESLTP